MAIVSNVTSGIVQSWLGHTVARGATLYTDGSPVYRSFDVSHHESVNHARGEYVRGRAHTNGVEGFWATVKRSHKGTYHSWSEKHLHRYLKELAGRFNTRKHLGACSGKKGVHMHSLLFVCLLGPLVTTH